MIVWRVLILPLGAHEGVQIGGDYIAMDPVHAQAEALMAIAGAAVLQPFIREGYTVDVTPSPTDPRFAANYDGPRPHVSNGGQC